MMLKPYICKSWHSTFISSIAPLDCSSTRGGSNSFIYIPIDRAMVSASLFSGGYWIELTEPAELMFGVEYPMEISVRAISHIYQVQHDSFNFIVTIREGQCWTDLISFGHIPRIFEQKYHVRSENAVVRGTKSFPCRLPAPMIDLMMLSTQPRHGFGLW